LDWSTLAAAAAGAVIALTGTILIDQLRRRHEIEESRAARSRDLYVQFTVSAGACHTQLRQIALSPDTHTDLDARTRAAFINAGIYELRERLFIDASDKVAAAGQAMFAGLRELRHAVADGATWSSPAFHKIYHPYLDAAWAYRSAVREELGSAPISPTVFGWVSLDGAATCPICRSGAAGAD
jgi:hypothetical protein